MIILLVVLIKPECVKPMVLSKNFFFIFQEEYISSWCIPKTGWTVNLETGEPPVYFIPVLITCVYFNHCGNSLLKGIAYMITHHECISTHPVICDSSDSACLLLQNFVKVVEEWGRRESGDLIQLDLSETSSWLPQKKQVLVSCYPILSHRPPSP